MNVVSCLDSSDHWNPQDSFNRVVFIDQQFSLKSEGSKVPIFVRKSTMRLPHRLKTPVIMIGPGTGFAPFRGFLQERNWQKKQGKNSYVRSINFSTITHSTITFLLKQSHLGQDIGPMILYYGCRHPEHDYIYEEELKKFVQDGVLSELHIAFSRVTAKKVGLSIFYFHL